MKERLSKKFIRAFNAGYSLQLPSITLSDVDAPEEVSTEIFTPLQPSLAVLYYQQLCDYFLENAPLSCQVDPRQEIHRLLARYCNNETYFKLFEAQYWGESLRLPVEKTVADRLQDVAEIKYRLKALKKECCLIQVSLNRLWECAASFAPSELKAKAQQCVEELQTHLDEYLAQLVKSGVAIPIQDCLRREIKKAAGKEFLARVVATIGCYHNEFSLLESSLEANTENRSLCQRFSDLLRQFLLLFRCLFVPHTRTSTVFFQASVSEQQVIRLTQHFLHRCEAIVGEKQTRLTR